MKETYISMVLVRIKGSRPYLFRLPSGKFVSTGAQVLVKTRHGEAQGSVVCTPLFMDIEDASALVEACGAYWPLAPVLGTVEVYRFEEAVENEQSDTVQT